MALQKRPNVKILLGNGNLATTVDNEDGLAMLVLSAPVGYTLTEALLYSRRGAELAGATALLDVANQALVYEHISDFYTEAVEGTPLQIVLVGANTTIQDIFSPGSPANTTIANRLKALNGSIRLLGVGLNPAAAEVAGAAGITADLAEAIPMAQAFADAEFKAFRPLDIVLEGRLFTGTTNNALDLRTYNAPNVAVTIGRDADRAAALVTAGIPVASKYAQVGRVLGRLSSIPVQRSLGRVKDKALVGVGNACLSGGKLVSELTDGDFGDLDILNGKGYIFPLIHGGKSGFFYNDDPTCSPLSKDNDYSFIRLSRTMNKAARVTRATYLEELLNDIDVDRATGYLAPIEVANFQNELQKALEDSMGANVATDGITVFVDPKQNVLSISKIQALVTIVPRGTNEQIEVTIQYNNPFKTS
jgi:hypothetical protein